MYEITVSITTGHISQAAAKAAEVKAKFPNEDVVMLFNGRRVPVPPASTGRSVEEAFFALD